MSQAEPIPLVKIRNLSIQRGGKPVLQIEHLDIFRHETLAVIGPNGAGKSTLLLSLARLLKGKTGEIWFGEQTIESFDELAYRRRIALVLQEPLLLDRTVFENVAAPLRFRRMRQAEISQRVEVWLERLGIAHLRDRHSRQISGGEAQRTSLARALVLQPELLLLDEPFSALDAPSRQRLLHDLRTLLVDSSAAVVFVTHDQDEALILGDRVAVILDGKLRQVGSPSQVFSAPDDEEIASFVGVENVLSGRISGYHKGQATVLVNGIQIHAVGQLEPGHPVLVCLRPEDITLWQDDKLPSSSARNRLHGTVKQITPSGPLARVEVACWGFAQLPTERLILVALVTRPSVEEMRLSPGSEVTVTFKASAVHLISR
jgi:molybdopterin-binding protein